MEVSKICYYQKNSFISLDRSAHVLTITASGIPYLENKIEEYLETPSSLMLRHLDNATELALS